MTYTLPSHLFQIDEEQEQCVTTQRYAVQEDNPLMKLSEVSFDRLRAATVTELFDISENAGIQEDELLSDSEDLRERLILMKRKLEGSSNKWKNLFRCTHQETKVKVEGLVQLIKTVEKTFQTIPTESLSEILRQEGHLQSKNLLKEISTRLKNLTERRSLVVVAGETNGGKSTFLNMLLGEDILPTDVLHCTVTICKIFYSEIYSIKTLDYDGIEEYFPCSSLLEVKAVLKSKLTQQEIRERQVESPVKEIAIGMPADILKSGVILVDTPGIGENEAMDDVTMNFIKSAHISAFIYIIKSDTAGGIQEDRLLSFLRAIKEQYSSNSTVEAFDPRAAMFVCNRWDNIEEQHREKVKMSALSKLDYVWPGFDASQTHFFSTRDTMKHLPVDPDFVTDSLMELMKGMKCLFDRASHNAIKHQYIWLKYMLQPASHHLKSMITHCIMSNEELEEYFRSVAEKQNRLMVSSTESSRDLQKELDKMSWELRALISGHLNFDSISPRAELQDCEEIISKCSSENFFVNQANRRLLDEMIVQSLLKHADSYIQTRKIVNEMESKILMAIQNHLGLFKCQINHIKHDMLHGMTARDSRSPSMISAELEDSGTSIRSSRASMISTGSDSSIEAFHGDIVLDPSQLAVLARGLQLRRKQGKSVLKPTGNSKHEIRQSLLGKIGDRIKHGVLNRTEPAVYVEDRVRKLARDIRENEEIIDSITKSYTEWIQHCVTHVVNSIPKFIEVNTKLMDEIREHRGIFQRNKDLLIKVMENLEPCRHHLKGYGLLYMDDINAETLVFNTEHRTSTVTVPKDILSESCNKSGSELRGTISHGLWTSLHGATIQIDNKANNVVIKTYASDLDEKVILPEIASLRCLEYTNVAPFLGMTRITTGSRREKDSSLGESEDLNEKVSAFIFKGDLVSVRAYRKRRMSSMQQFIPEMIQSLLCGLNYLHRERLVHMELNLNTVMVQRESGKVKLCQMCKPREAIFPANLETPTEDYVCLSPSVLQGNIYETTDDIYAVGLLLWEILCPDKLPYQTQRSWTLKMFIDDCHPVNMLQADIDSLTVSDSVREVLKRTLLISRGNVCLPLATIQSLLLDLHNEPAIRNVKSKPDLKDTKWSSTASLPAPVVEITSPSGTEVTLNFTFDGSIDEPDDSSGSIVNSCNLSASTGKINRLPAKHDYIRNKLGKKLFVSSSEDLRRVSDSDIRKHEVSSAKLKNPFKFVKKFFNRGSSKKPQDEEEKQTENIESDSNMSSEASVPLDESYDVSIQRPQNTGYFTPQMRPKRRLKNTHSDNPSASGSSYKHTSLPDRLLSSPKSVNLRRKESFDVPTLMSEKFRVSVTNRLSPLSNLTSESYLSGSMPSLVGLKESTTNDNNHLKSKQESFFARSYNPRMQPKKSPLAEFKKRHDTLLPDSSWNMQQTHDLHSERSLQDFSTQPFIQRTYFPRSNLPSSASMSNLPDMLNTENSLLQNVDSPLLKRSAEYPSRISPTTMINQTDQNVKIMSTDSLKSMDTITDLQTVENMVATLLSSSSSSREADSGFSTESSGREAQDLLGSCDEWQTDIPLKINPDYTRHLHDETDDEMSKDLDTANIVSTHTNSSPDTLHEKTVHSLSEVSADHIQKAVSITENLEDLYADSKTGIQKQSREAACSLDNNNNKSIPVPPPLDFAVLSFNYESEDEDSDER
ncbi:hypothetical protein BsWGS_13927 [Bradybaena similaris]